MLKICYYTGSRISQRFAKQVMQIQEIFDQQYVETNS